MIHIPFFYNREAQIRKLDEAGQPIPVKIKKPGVNPGDPEIEEIVPGKFETETVIYEDHFDLCRVIRTHTVRPGEVVVLLDDGHEVTDVVDQELISKNKPATRENVRNIKGRVWVQSEILLKGEEAVKYYAALRDIKENF